MDTISKLINARRFIFQALQKEIINSELDHSIYQLKILFSQGTVLYIRYNKYDEYAYQVIFSKRKGDWIRYDNFDDIWSVSTKPHHFHSRYNKPIMESRMIGDPEHDMPKLIEFLKETLFIKNDG